MSTTPYGHVRAAMTDLSRQKSACYVVSTTVKKLQVVKLPDSFLITQKLESRQTRPRAVDCRCRRAKLLIFSSSSTFLHLKKVMLFLARGHKITSCFNLIHALCRTHRSGHNHTTFTSWCLLLTVLEAVKH